MLHFISVYRCNLANKFNLSISGFFFKFYLPLPKHIVFSLNFNNYKNIIHCYVNFIDVMCLNCQML